MDHFDAFHAKIQILANLNESIVNSHFPEQLGRCLPDKDRPPMDPSAAQTDSEPAPTTSTTAQRGPPTLRPKIPLELVELIIRNLTKPELLPILRANKALHSVAIRSLYRELSEGSPIRLLTLLNIVLRNDSVHQHVRKLDFNIASLECPTANLYRLLHRVLQHTSGLTSLALDLPKAQSPIWIFDGIGFKLKQFSTSMHCTPELARFLDGQDRITSLTLRGFQRDALQSLPYIYMQITPDAQIPILEDDKPETRFVLAPTSLPRLTVFNAIHAGPALVREVIKGRPVTTVSIPLFSQNARLSLDALEGSEASLKRLSLISFDPNAPSFIFEQVADRFKELEALHIVVLLAEFTNELLLAACQHLHHFKRLKYVTCVATSSEESSLAEEQEIAERWHEECPSLRTIILPRGRVWFQKPARVVAGKSWECLDD